MFSPVFRKHRQHFPDHGKKPSDFDVYLTRKRTWQIAAFSLACAALSLGYYLVIYMPAEAAKLREVLREEAQMNQRLEEAKLQAEEERQLRWERAQQLQFEKNAAAGELQGFLLDQCVAEAEETYVQLWDRECFARQMGDDCRLGDSVSATLNAHLKELKDACYKHYPQSPPAPADAADRS